MAIAEITIEYLREAARADWRAGQEKMRNPMSIPEAVGKSFRDYARMELKKMLDPISGVGNAGEIKDVLADLSHDDQTRFIVYGGIGLTGAICPVLNDALDPQGTGWSTTAVFEQFNMMVSSTQIPTLNKEDIVAHSSIIARLLKIADPEVIIFGLNDKINTNKARRIVDEKGYDIQRLFSNIDTFTAIPAIMIINSRLKFAFRRNLIVFSQNWAQITQQLTEEHLNA